MKRLLLSFIALVLGGASCLLATSIVAQVAGRGHWKNKPFHVMVDRKHVQAVRWKPQDGRAPFDMQRATNLARAALRKMVGSAEQSFDCVEMRLCADLATRGAYWFYVIEFSSDEEESSDGTGSFPATLPFIVYFDGITQSPVAEEEPNKAPEPTPTSVTPPANSR